MEILRNQKDEYISYYKQMLIDTLNEYMPPDCQIDEYLLNKAVAERSKVISKCMLDGIDVGEIVAAVKIPNDIVYINGSYCWAVQSGKREEFFPIALYLP